MAVNLIPEKGWRPMELAEKDCMQAYVVRFRENNKPNGEVRVQFARWLPNNVAEWAWRPAWNPNGGVVWADAWMHAEDFQKACRELTALATPEFDL